MTTLAVTKFRSFGLTLPSFVSFPTGRPPNVAQYLVQSQLPGILIAPAPLSPVPSPSLPTGLKVVGLPTLQVARPTATPLSVPPALFKSASNDRVDVSFQQEASDAYSNYISAACHAIATAHEMWRTAACISNAIIMGPNVTGGSIMGPPLLPNIVANLLPQQTALWGVAGTFTQAIANAISAAWQQWASAASIPGMPWYPAFAAFPGPMAPPTPNVPCPVVALAGSSLLTSTILAQSMSQRLTQAQPYSTQLFQSIAEGFSTAVSTWMQGQQITGALGSGPVPTFAPPYVPVGSVVSGTIAQGPHFIA